MDGQALRTIKIRLAYDGAAFVGWQRQAAGVSIQGLLEDALARIEGRAVQVIGAGRTDAGVHAIGQVASARLAHAIDVVTLRRALNAILPDEIRVLAVDDAPGSFHARYGARAKSYRYQIVNAETAGPFLHPYVWRVAQPLEVGAMQRAARAIEGCRDFAAFEATGSSARATTRTVTSSEVRERGSAVAWPTPDGPTERPGGRLITYDITGDGFLRHMVRNIVGTLVEIGLGRRDMDSMAELLASRDRARAGPTAPAQGLFLTRVDY